ncbi:MAG: hypothetical protein ACREV5_06545 [Steroidobacter sp.]
MTRVAPLGLMQSTLMADPYALAARGALWLSGLVAVVTLAAALYMLAPSMRADRSMTSVALHDATQSRWSPAALEPEGEPVRVTNPFDESEVFEFPEGTSDAEARDAMAEMLLQRAQQRYAQLDRRTHKR